MEDTHPLLTWMTDSANVTSVHRNYPGLTFKESYIGHLVRKDGVWGFAVGAGEPMFFRDYPAAYRALEELACNSLPEHAKVVCRTCPHLRHEGLCKTGMGCFCKGEG